MILTLGKTVMVKISIFSFSGKEHHPTKSF